MTPSRHHLSVILALSILVIGGALFSQYVGGLRPCELCLLQRWPYYAAIPLAAAGVAAGRRAGRAALVLCALLFVADAGLAFYHVGVEYRWFPGPDTCTGGAGKAMTIEALRAQILAARPIRCDEPQWSLFGVTLAGWNLVAALFLTGLSLRGLLSDRNHP